MTDYSTWGTKNLGTTLVAWVNTVNIDRTIGRDPRTDRDAARAVATRQELMDELHAEALELHAYLQLRDLHGIAENHERPERQGALDELHALALVEHCDRATARYLAVTYPGQYDIDALHAEALKITPRGIVTEIAAGPDGIRTRIVEPRCAVVCGITGTEDCPTDEDAQRRCPTC